MRSNYWLVTRVFLVLLLAGGVRTLCYGVGETLAPPADSPAQASAAAESLPALLAYVWVVVGILLSIALPILRGMLPRPTPPAGRTASWVFWSIAKPYVIVGAFSLLTGILVLAYSIKSLTSWSLAVLAGYAWDSTLQKLIRGAG